MGTNVLLTKIHKTPPEVDFESSRSPAKSESWNKPNLQCCAVSQMRILSEIVCVMSVRKQPCQSFVTCLSHFVTDLASLLTDHRMSGAKNKHCKTICEQTSDNSLTDSSSSFLN